MTIGKTSFSRIVNIITLTFLLLACESKTNNQRSLSIIDQENEPVYGVIVTIGTQKYKTNILGKVDFYLDNSIQSMKLVIKKEGYNTVNLNVPNSFFGTNDQIAISKIELIQPDTTAIVAEEILEEVVEKQKPKITRPIAEKEKAPEIVIVEKEYSELYSEAEFYKEAGNWNEAISNYEQISRDDLDLFTKAKFNSGVIKQTHQNNFSGAINDYTAALETQNPKNFAEIYYNRGVCYYNLSQWSNASADFNRSFRYATYFTGAPTQIKKKHHDLIYFWADALVRKANLESDKTRQLNYYKEAVNKIEDYLDRFEGYDSGKTKQMNSTLKNFNKKITDSRNG